MYKNYFGFNHSPFSIAPDPKFLFMSDGHREALAHLLYGIEADGCFVLLTGEIGAGKTTICRCLLEQLPPATKVAYITNTMLSVSELLATICDEFGIRYPVGNTSPKIFIDHIKHFLLTCLKHGQKPVLIIDEAQNLSTDVLEQIRLLTNLETNEQKLLMIIMLGQPELREKLAAPELKQLRHRITARYHLNPLSKNEVIDYIRHRLAVAGVRRKLFCNATFNKIYKLSNGIPRLINSICDRALLGTYTKGASNVDKKTLLNAANEYFDPNEIKRHLPVSYIGAVCGLLILFGCSFLFFSKQYSLVRKYLPPQQIESILSDSTAVKQDVNNSLDTYPATNSFEQKRVEVSLTRGPIPDEPAVEKQLPEPELVSNAVKDEVEAPVPTNVLPNENMSVYSNSMEWLSNLPIEESKAIAFGSLFQQWGKAYTPDSYALACDQAETVGLNCFYFKGNLGMLQKLNRPTLLSMVNENGQEYYATLIGLTENEAVLDIAGEQRKTSRSNLERHWFGTGILLWQTPPEYQSAAKPGDTTPWLDWLAEKYANLGFNRSFYSNVTLSGPLLEHTRQMQSANGFIPDGIIGPQTIICLNTLTDAAVPTLSNRRHDFNHPVARLLSSRD